MDEAAQVAQAKAMAAAVKAKPVESKGEASKAFITHAGACLHAARADYPILPKWSCAPVCIVQHLRQNQHATHIQAEPLRCPQMVH